MLVQDDGTRGGPNGRVATFCTPTFCCGIAHAARTTGLGLAFAIRRMSSELPVCGGDDGTRTHDPLRAKQVL
jgi:hypothetical protein